MDSVPWHTQCNFLMEEYNYKKARKDMTRAMHSIEKYARKKLAQFDDPKLVIGVSYVSEYNKAITMGWKFAGDPILQAKLTEWIPSMENALCVAEVFEYGNTATWTRMPASAEKRAEKTRKGLQLLWREHVRYTPYAEKKQMFSLVKQGVCRKFEWWDRVTDNAPFESISIDNPRISEKLFKHIAPLLQSM